MLESPPPKQLVPDLPTLVPGLALRELTVKDADAYYKLLDNNRRHLTRLGDYQAEGNATSAWVREHLSTDPGQSLRYGIRLKGELIGRVDLTAADPPRYGTGYWLGEAYVGKGYAMAACAPPYTTMRHANFAPPTSSPVSRMAMPGVLPCSNVWASSR